jgi:FMN phosphatase YigB (HAD superfamily)
LRRERPQGTIGRKDSASSWLRFSIISYRYLEAVLSLYDKTLSKNLKLKERAKETLLAARDNGFRIMVVSEGPHDAQEATLKRLGIAPLVDLLVTSAAERTSKQGTAENSPRQGAMLTA